MAPDHPNTVVAITGAAGYLGRLTRAHLRQRGFSLRLFDIAPIEDVAANEVAVQGDLSSFDNVALALQGANFVVHLAASLSVDDWQPVLESNIAGTYNIYEAARQQGIGRIVYASSHHVAGMYSTRDPIDLGAPARPDSLYGLSKCFGENLAQYYWDKFGVETVALRIGSARPEPREARERYTWLSEPDYCRLIDASIGAPRVGFTPVWGVSDNDGGWWTNEAAFHLGFRPRDNAADHLGPPAPASSDPMLELQGGKRALHRLGERRGDA
ncbi:MAG: NAD(P)-dependent oxidoreductase [Hyphomicrobiales bacterium]|nr:MAG: NAD(P)-dependent oxidoreductase [Hyphomicrobiales bacterium]